MTSPVAVLRPEPGNTRTAARVEALGLCAIRLPLFAVVPLAWTPRDPAAYDALLATSANAFRGGGDGLAHLRSLPVWAVGQATAAAARRAGFTVETVGDADAASLAARSGDRRLLHLAGRDHHPVAGADTRIVYAARMIGRRSTRSTAASCCSTPPAPPRDSPRWSRPNGAPRSPSPR